MIIYSIIATLHRISVKGLLKISECSNALYNVDFVLKNSSVLSDSKHCLFYDIL